MTFRKNNLNIMLFLQLVRDERTCLVSTNNIELISYHVLFPSQHVALQGDVDKKKKILQSIGNR